MNMKTCDFHQLSGIRQLVGTMLLLILLIACSNNRISSANDDPEDTTRDLIFFLKRMRTLDHLPQLEASHTAMSSTWDTTGNNNDGRLFKNIIDTANILLDVDGPGCINRIFVGRAYLQTHDTRLQIFIDKNDIPVFDVPVGDLFDPVRSPFPYPLSSNKTYPGILFPIPYDKHVKVQLYNPLAENWGNYWQVTYTTYPGNVKVKSISYPFSASEEAEIKKVVDVWLDAERNPPAMPASWPFIQKIGIKAGESGEITLSGTAVIKQLYISATPNTRETWLNTRFVAYWDGTEKKSIDVPLGYLFGNADYASMFRYNSLLTGITADGAYSMFPMPFEDGARFVFTNNGNKEIELEVKMVIEKKEILKPNTGRLHATFNEVQPYGSGYDSLPHFGKSPRPFLVTLDQSGCSGKYVGTRLHVAWPSTIWWGEGDWLFWTDEDGFPPSYHGTGSEEYFNSGWGYFDRKAISGYVKMRPGNVNVYSYHLNDAFNFSNSIKAAVEIWWLSEDIMKSIYGSTALWYADKPRDAGSRKDLAFPRLLHNGDIKGDPGVWEDTPDK
jgi:hypothetical protein